jgi:PAS domain S-box-containing protein
MWDWDLLTDQLVWTDQCRSLFGFPAGTVVTYERFLAAVHPADRERVANQTEYSLREHKEFHAEYRAIWSDGSVHWLADRGKVVYDAQDRPVRMIGAVMDVTAVRQSEERLTESEARFQRFIESNVIGITIDDLEGTIHEANDAFLSLVGYTRADLAAGRLSWTKLTAPDYQEINARILAELQATGSFQPTEVEYISREGKRVPALVGGTLFRPQEPSTRGISFILDQTAPKAIEQQKDLFLSVTSHELKTPLTALKGTLQLLQRRARRLLEKRSATSSAEATFLEDVARQLKSALRQVDLQARLINDLLDVSRIATNTLELGRQLCDLRTVVSDALENLRMAAPERAINLSLPEQPAPVLADCDRIHQVIANYVTNALRYAPDGDPLEVRLTLQEQHARVEVQDHGPGIAPDAQASIWQRFHQLKGRPNSGQGLGLGLYICRTLITQHGGEVGVESVPGQGATFWFTLPLEKSPLPCERRSDVG